MMPGRTLLGKRYEYDGKRVMRLNRVQTQMKQQLDAKVKAGTYTLEDVPCCVCRGADFDLLAEKDRFGLRVAVVICRQCGLIQTNPRMTEESYRSFYNEEYRALEGGKTEPDDEFFQAQYAQGRRVFEYLQAGKLLPVPADQLSVLEVGCGAGGILQYFRDKGSRVTGIDLGEEYVRFGKTRHGLELSVGTIRDVSFAEAPRLIIYSHVLEHTLRPDEELRSIRSVLPDDGIVYVEAPGVKDLRRTFDMDLLRFLRIAHTYHFTLSSLTNLTGMCGFETIAGDEGVRCVLKKSCTETSRQGIVNDYGPQVEYLRELERLRRSSPLRPYLHLFRPRMVLKRGLKLLGLRRMADRL